MLAPENQNYPIAKLYKAQNLPKLIWKKAALQSEFDNYHKIVVRDDGRVKILAYLTYLRKYQKASSYLLPSDFPNNFF